MMQNRRSNVDMVGILAREAIYEGDRYVQPMTVNKNNDLVFTIQPLSNFSSDVQEDIESLQCYQNELFEWGFTDSVDESEELRKSNLADFLADYLIIFKPEKRKSGETDYYHVAREVRLVALPDRFSSEMLYEPIPIFKSNDDGQSFHRGNIEFFEERLLQHKYIGKCNSMSREAEDYPRAIIWENSEERYLYTGIESHNNTIEGVRYKVSPQNIKKYRIIVEWEDQICPNTGNEEDILFVPIDLLGEDKLKKLEPAMINNLQDFIVEEPQNNSVTSNISELESKVASEEDIFMRNFISITRSKKYNLYYEEKDLFNFHTAMKTENMVILAGLSGTGKSKLVQAYADALQLKEGQFKVIPVRPFWQDDSDLLGYADTLNSIYRAGDSGLVDTLIDAEQKERQLYIICFDEMNLAKVEHYFSQFLSVLEMNSDKRKINLYSQDLANRFYNSEKYPHEIKISRNVMFVGTVNLDESTYSFSDKVLDRSNVIKLNVLPFTSMLENKEILEKSSEVKKGIDYYTYKEFFIKNEGLNKYELEFLWELHLIVNEYNKNIGIGWRVVKQIDEYLKNLPINSPLDKNEAFDLQIVQRILTKLRGTEEQLKGLLGSNDTEGSLIELLNRYHGISEFNISRNVILEKIKELNIHGYAM